MTTEPLDSRAATAEQGYSARNVLAGSTRIGRWNERGLSGVLLALVASSWWMLPRALDAALASTLAETAKFVSLPLCVGAPIALSWPRLSTVARGFVLANVVPMWTVVGWLYIAAPLRLCFYLADQQVTAGIGLLWASGVAALTCAVLAFCPSDLRPQSQDAPAERLPVPE